MMKQIQLSEGLILLSGEKRMGKTRLSLKLANYLAQNEKVLFLNFDDYEERLRLFLLESEYTVNENLHINTTLEGFSMETYMELLSILEKNNYSTIIIDEFEKYIDSYRGYINVEYDLNKVVTEALLFLVRHFKCRIIINYKLNQYQVNFNWGVEYPGLDNIKYPRVLVNECAQIFYLFIPSKAGFSEDDEGNSLADNIELHSLKNKDHLEELLILNNRDVKIL